MGRQGLLPQAVTGVVSQLVRGVTKDGRSRANRIFAKQGFSSVRAFVETRDQLEPIMHSDTKLGDTVTFQLTSNHHITSFVDFRCRLPGLNAAGLVRNPWSGTINYGFPDAPNNFCVNPGVQFSAYTGDPLTEGGADAAYNAADPSTKWRYRIPTNPGMPDFIGNTDYAVIPGGYPTPQNYTGLLSDFGAAKNYHDNSAPAHVAPNAIWVDYIGYYMLEWIEVRYSTALLMRFTGEDMLKLHLKHHSSEQRDYYRVMTGGHSAGPAWTTEDILDASYAKDICVPLDLLFWVGKMTESLPMTGASRPLEIKIKLRNPEYCYLFQKFDQTHPTDPHGTDLLATNTLVPVAVPLRNVRLEVHEYFINAGEQKHILGMLDSNDGYMWKCWDVEKITDLRLDPSQHTNACSILMQGIKGGVNFLFITKIHQQDKQTPFATFWTNWLRINDYEIVAGKEEAYPLTDHFYDQYRLANLHANAPIHATHYNIYCAYYSKIPSDKFNDWGNLEFANLYNPTIRLRYSVDYANPITSSSANALQGFLNTSRSSGSPIYGHSHILELTAFVHQFIHFKSGELNSVLT